jgi:hypothetical protein
MDAEMSSSLRPGGGAFARQRLPVFVAGSLSGWILARTEVRRPDDVNDVECNYPVRSLPEVLNGTAGGIPP